MSLGTRVRSTAALTLLILLPACTVRPWSPHSAEGLARRRSLQGKRARIAQDGELLTLRITRLRYPLLEGVPQPGPGRVAVAIDRVIDGELRVLEPNGSLVRRPITAASLTHEDVVGRDVQLRLADGVLALHVSQVRDRQAVGRPIACWGEGGGSLCTAAVTVDLRTARLIEVHDNDLVVTPWSLLLGLLLSALLAIGLFARAAQNL